jgi:hypothetical protein
MNAPIDLNEQVAALQRQVFSLLLALIVVSGTLTVYLYRQASMTGKDITALHQQYDGMIRAFQQNQTGMISFVNQLVIYSETHPEFRPVLIKFGVNPPPAAPKK